MNIDIKIENPLSGGQTKDDNTLPCCKRSCKRSWTDISEVAALIVFILNVCSPGFGTFCAGIIDKQGLRDSGTERRSQAMLTGFLQFLLTPVMLIGWIWSILHGFRLYRLY